MEIFNLQIFLPIDERKLTPPHTLKWFSTPSASPWAGDRERKRTAGDKQLFAMHGLPEMGFRTNKMISAAMWLPDSQPCSDAGHIWKFSHLSPQKIVSLLLFSLSVSPPLLVEVWCEGERAHSWYREGQIEHHMQTWGASLGHSHPDTMRKTAPGCSCSSLLYT